MKYQAASTRTKRALAESLKKLMRTKPFAKITVTEIVRDCGVNRKTFYYHFEDIYALLRWIFEEEAVNIVRKFDLMHNYDDALDFIYGYIRENKDLLRNAYDAFGSVELGRFLHESLYGLTASHIESMEREKKLRLPDASRDYLCEFLTEAVSGMLLNIVSGAMPIDGGKALKATSAVIRASITGVLSEQGVPFEPDAV